MEIKRICFCLGLIALLLAAKSATATFFYVNANNPAPASPYSTWPTAATNIQDAIALANTGDTVLVTNGTYAYGGQVMEGDLVNRVALTNAITVQSLNGPWVTTILGAGATNGTAAVRCAWLTNGAALVGFTLTAGATRTAGDTVGLQSGGAAWCASSNAFIGNCVIVSNASAYYAGAVYQGTIQNSLISSNATLYPGGGGITCQAVLNSCTIVNNNSYGAANALAMTNCILYFNGANGSQNYSGSGVASSHCCTTPTLFGPGDFTTPPQLCADGVHLLTNSPCIGAGINLVKGTDIFGNTWSNWPAVGCAEWTPRPVATTPQITLTNNPIGFTVGNLVVGTPSACAFAWLKNGAPLQDNGHFTGTQTTNLTATGVSYADAGSYQVVVSNVFGAVTSAVAPLVVHCVNIAGANPVAPYTTWATAATNIQDAIGAAAAGDVVLVTDGLYAAGGKSMDGVITNRVSLDKAILLQSVNGAAATVIQGAWDPIATNGPGAVRCAWLTTNAIINGFTLSGGATRAYAVGGQTINGGGIWGPWNIFTRSPVSAAANCCIIGNAASGTGGGAFQVALVNCTVASNTMIGSAGGSGGGAGTCTLKNCVVTANVATGSSSLGGGTVSCNLTNCAVTRNSAMYSGGGAYSGTLVNCTVTGNQVGSTSAGTGGGVANCYLANCIVWTNQTSASTYAAYANSTASTFSYSCTTPAAGGTGNLAVNPLLLGDGIHLSTASPCIGAGSASVISGTDIDGQPWNNPPSIGCDEWQPAPVSGGQPTFQIGSPPHGLTCSADVAGQAPIACFWSKDGVPIQDDGHHSNSGTPNLVVNNLGPADAGAYQVVAANSFGAVTSAVAVVVIHAVNAAGVNPVAPYSTWATAATTIQDAINAASAGDVVVVTNGIYSTGGMVMAGGLTNRVALNKPINVMSANGCQATVIQGAWDPIATNGPDAVRCAYVADGAVLNGFTLENGATLAAGDSYPGGPLESGGGVLCNSFKGVVADCVLTNNSALWGGGGIANGTLNNSLVLNNNASDGGGALDSMLNNCTVMNNFASIGAGTFGGYVKNCILVNNYYVAFYIWQLNNYDSSAQIYYSCTSPTVVGNGNINVNPLFLDLFHISSCSPCCGTGSAAYASGFDLDGEAWNNQPSMGCDEVVLSNRVGSLSVNLTAFQTNLLANRPTSFSGSVTGRASYVEWSFGDGSTVTNVALSSAHQWANLGNYTLTFTAYNNDNPAGVATNIVVYVQPLTAPQIQPPVILTNGFHFQFAGQAQADYFIEYSTSLVPPVTWNPLQSIYFNNQNVVQVIDSSTNNPARFYRVLAQ